MVIFFLSVYLSQKLHFTVQQTGVIMACFGAGSFTGAFTGGKLTDRVGYHPVMLVSLLIGGILFMLIPFFSSYLMLCIAFFVLSTFSESFRPANMTAIAYYSKPENYTRSISLNRLAINLGFSVGPALGGILASYNYNYLFFANGFTCISAAAIIFIFLKNQPKRLESDQQNASKQNGSPYSDKIYLFFIVAAYLYALCFFQFFITMPLYYKTVRNFTETDIGLLMALNGVIVALVEMIMVYKIEGRWSLYKLIALGALLLSVSYLSLLFITTIHAFVLLIVVISFSEMFAMPFMNSFMNKRSTSTSRGQYAALYAMAWSTAQTTLPIVATQTIAFAGYNALWILMTTLSLCMALMIIRVEKKVFIENNAL